MAMFGAVTWAKLSPELFGVGLDGSPRLSLLEVEHDICLYKVAMRPLCVGGRVGA